MKRVYAHTETFAGTSDEDSGKVAPRELGVEADAANLVTSLTDVFEGDPREGMDFDYRPDLDYRNPLRMHAPAIDIDGIEVHVVPSSTTGNYHLFIDKAMPAEHYFELLDVLAKVGIVEPGYVNASRTRGYSSLRWNCTKRFGE